MPPTRKVTKTSSIVIGSQVNKKMCASLCLYLARIMEHILINEKLKTQFSYRQYKANKFKVSARGQGRPYHQEERCKYTSFEPGILLHYLPNN